MTITEMIKELETIRAKEGDIRVTVFDEYTYAEGYKYNMEELWLDVSAKINDVVDNDNNKIEKVVVIG